MKKQKSNENNLILCTDAYKQTHWLQYPRGTKFIFSYLESRGGAFPYTRFFGLQALLKKYFTGRVVTSEMIDEAEEFCSQVFGTNYFNRKGWERVVKVHGGRLPLRIRAVPEGMVIPTRNVLMTVENTDPEVPFLTNFVETPLMHVWYPTTVCTLSYSIKQLVGEYAALSGAPADLFALNDFGYRGVSSKESAGAGAAAHLVNFLGTDTLAGIQYAMNYYDSGVCGYSVLAAEHSTVTIYGKENEAEAYRTFLALNPDGVVAIVSDSYDLYNAVKNIYGKQLKEQILARSGKLVIRPDSGYPPEVCTKTLELLWDAFGGTTNSRGYRVLNPKVGVIYGDGINREMIGEILKAVTEAGFSTENVVFGMGGALLQQVNRDTCNFAFKCSAGRGDGDWFDVYKDPVTDTGKRSKRGRLDLLRKDDSFVAVREGEKLNGYEPQLVTVFENGELVREWNFDQIRARQQ